VRFWQAITVQRSDSSVERVDTCGGRLVVSDAARDAIGRLCRDDRRQALLLCWPGGVACLPVSLYAPAAFDVIIGHLALPYLRRCTSAPVHCRHPRRSRRDSGMCAATAASAQARSPRAGTSTARRGGAAMTTAVMPQVCGWVSRELQHEFAGVLPEPVVTACVRDPVADRHGSIQRQSTPADCRQAGHGAAGGDGPSAPTSGHGDQLAGRPIFGASTHRLAASPPRKGGNGYEQWAPNRPAAPGIHGVGQQPGSTDTQRRGRRRGRRSAFVRQSAPADRAGMPAARAAPRRMPVHRSAGAIAVAVTQPIRLGEQSPISRSDQDRIAAPSDGCQRLPPADAFEPRPPNQPRLRDDQIATGSTR
jgi:hypothetical protein